MHQNWCFCLSSSRCKVFLLPVSRSGSSALEGLGMSRLNRKHGLLVQGSHRHHRLRGLGYKVCCFPYVWARTSGQNLYDWKDNREKLTVRQIEKPEICLARPPAWDGLTGKTDTRKAFNPQPTVECQTCVTNVFGNFTTFDSNALHSA